MMSDVNLVVREGLEPERTPSQISKLLMFRKF